jgi:bifunctional enzyme CysN/CysC
MAKMNKENIEIKKEKSSGLIWITGFSASGKTTISRKVEYLLKKNNYKTIHLDGDDLRTMFGHSWGYERANRIELAHIYFRMCNHLSEQGYVVVISAVAMFKDITSWVRENIKNSMQVYLDVPTDVRRHRDALTKGIFIEKDLNDGDYDVPISPDLIIENYGNMDTDQAASKIFEKFSVKNEMELDYNRTSYWDTYYGKQVAPVNPSSFAMYVESKIENKQKILEIGCGNGRDSIFFSEGGHSVTAFDRSEGAIESCKRNHINQSIDFISGSLSDIDSLSEDNYNLVYSRFVFHAMPLEEELKTIQKSYELLKNGGSIYIECRSVDDPLFRKGELLSRTERIDGHYRRFIVLNELLDRLQSVGFKIIEAIEDKGLAVYGDDDPVVIRVCAKKV